MNIRPKIILVVLPLIIAPLVMAAFVSYLSARNGISAVASDFLQFKSQMLSDYMDGQWSLLVDNNLTDEAEYVSAARGAVSVFASSLVRSSSEIIVALDDKGNIVMSSRATGISPGTYPELVLSGEEKSTWNGALELDGARRVAYIDSFSPWGWTTIVSEAWDTFYSPVTRIAVFIAIIGTVSLVIALVFLFVATGLIAKPLEGMVGVIENMMDTMDLSSRVPVLYKDETGKLAHSFNLMTESLDQANKDIKDFALRAVFAHRQAILAQKEAEEARNREENLNIIFRKYVPQAVIDDNVGRLGKDLRGSREPFVSVLMSDIRNFTSITEKMQPQELVDSLNRYFEAMVDVIDDRGGITDKYIGDAVMALFGVLEKKDDDVLRSVYAGLEMLEALEQFNIEQAQRGIRPFRIGIGLHYGRVTAGNIGSDKKMDFTVIGETVNLASRLEGLTKFYNTPLIISETVQQRVKEAVDVRLLDKVSVKGSDLRDLKGRIQGMPIYAAVRKVDPESEELWNICALGQRRYYDRDFPGAKKAFQDALKRNPDDFPSKIFLERTLTFLKTPPPEDWTGAYRHENK